MSSRLSVAHGEIFDLRMRFLGQAKRQQGGWRLGMTMRVLTTKITTNHLKIKPTMTKKETAKFIVQLIASIASAILTALGATSCMGM